MKGWFRVPGIRPDGDRTIDEQMLGLAPALAEAKGKTVLDLGCAEGCISAEFARAGARVVGIELLRTHLEVARKVCAGLDVTFHCAHLGDWIKEHPPERFDIVLALGIIHKLEDPCLPLRWAAQSAGDLLCFRGPGRVALKLWDGIIAAKHGKGRCNVPQTLTAEGFVMEQSIDGVRNEAVQYWRRLPPVTKEAGDQKIPEGALKLFRILNKLEKIR